MNAGVNGSRRPPAKCNRCQVNRVAWVQPRVDYCYQCLPGGPFETPPCRACGSKLYFSEGLCERCHPGGPLYLGSCRGCLAWGVYRAHSWLCWVCRWWKTHYPLGECLYCSRETRVGVQGACRLCLEQARAMQEPGRALDLAGANAEGQQLFFANMAFHRRKTPRLKPQPRVPEPGSDWRQGTLFDIDPDPDVVLERVRAPAVLLCRDRSRARDQVRVEQAPTQRRLPIAAAPAGPSGDAGRQDQSHRRAPVARL